MPINKVKEFIKKLGAPRLTKEQAAIIKDHHEYHGDKRIKIIGTLPGEGVFVKCISHTGQEDSVIDRLCYEKDCSEDAFIREAGEEQEIRLIKKWLIRNLPVEERRALMEKGYL